MAWHKAGLSMIFLGLLLIIGSFLVLFDPFMFDGFDEECSIILIFIGFGVILAGNGFINFQRAYIEDKRRKEEEEMDSFYENISNEDRKPS